MRENWTVGGPQAKASDSVGDRVLLDDLRARPLATPEQVEQHRHARAADRATARSLLERRQAGAAITHRLLRGAATDLDARAQHAALGRGAARPEETGA